MSEVSMDLGLLTAVPDGMARAGLAATDPRFLEVAALVERGQYGPAAAAAGALLADGIYDVRAVAYYAFGAFLDGGVAGLAPVASALAELLTARWEALGPEAGKARHAQASLGWLLRSMARKLQREEDTKSAEWERWVALAPEELAAALAALDALRGAAGTALGERASVIAEAFSKVTQLLRGLEEAARQRPLPSATVEARSTPEPSVEGVPAAVAPRPAPGEGVEPRGRPAAPPPQAAADAGAPALRALLAKLAAYEQLVGAGKLTHAQIVADDVQATLEHFDPRVFFPGLFRSFLRVKAASAAELAAAEEQRDSPAWRALADYYRVDLEGFLEL